MNLHHIQYILKILQENTNLIYTFYILMKIYLNKIQLGKYYILLLQLKNIVLARILCNY